MQPASSAGATLLLIRPMGAFHGMIAPTTPTGSRTSRPNWPADGFAGSSNGNVLARSANPLKVRSAPMPPPRAMAASTPDSRGQIWPMSSARRFSSAPIARRYSARCSWVSHGHGPLSKASRAAPTAREMSAACASGTLK